MIKVLFICHGNICRSPMAEFVMKDLAEKSHTAPYFHIASAATSRDRERDDDDSMGSRLMRFFGVKS